MVSEASSEGWDGDAVRGALTGTRYDGLIQHHASVASTNALAVEAAQAGAPEYSVWVADEQSAGRGRGGHRWHSERGAGLYVSVLLRPRMEAVEALRLSLATGLAVRGAVRELTGVAPDLRWPNDLLVAEKKVGGILVEAAAGPGGGGAAVALRYAVMGIGLNVGHRGFPEELEGVATSLYVATGVLWRREALLCAILRALAGEIDRMGMEGKLLQRFAEASTWVLGKRVRVGEGEGYTGVTAGLDERGFLRVRDVAGALRTVLSGGVRAA